MASSAINVLSGIAAAAAGLAGEKVSKDGSVPGLDLATIIPALLGNKSGGTGGNLLGTLASAASKSGLLTSSNLGKVAELAGSLLSIKKTTEPAKTTNTSAAGGIAGLAAAILGGGGTASNLGTIASLATTLAGTASTDKQLTTMAGDLGKTLSSSFGVSLNGTTTAVKGLDKVLPSDTKSTLFTSILKGLIS